MPYPVAAVRGRSPRGTASAAFDPSIVTGYTRDWNFADPTKLYTDIARTTLVSADADPIGAVICGAGSGVYLPAAADTNRPSYKTAIQNGLSVARFDNTDDYLGHATAITADASQTIFIILNKRSAPTSATDTILWMNAAIMLSADSDVSATGFRYQNPDTAITVATANNFNILCLKYTSTASLTIYGNGGAGQALDPSDNIATATALYLGASSTGTNPGDWDIGRVLIYSAALSNADLDYLFSGLGTLWNITVTPVS